MGFSRRDPDDAMQWRRLQAKVLDGEDEPVSETRAIGEALTEGSTASVEGEAETDEVQPISFDRPARQPIRTPATRVSEDVVPLSPEAAERLTAIKRAAARIRRLQKAAVDLTRTYRVGQRVYDPTAQAFGRVVYAAEGYVRLQLSDGTHSAHGKPPLEDRRAFVLANFDRMDNRTMAEILGISVHTMRRLCHEYGLRRHGTKKKSA